jgi:hypothetical protein
MDAACAARETSAMARYHHDVYARANTPRYLVVLDLQWQVIECERLQPSANLGSAMNTTINRLVGDGWKLENTVKFGFVFLNRNGIRRLLMLTERDPLDRGSQAFSPFK